MEGHKINPREDVQYSEARAPYPEEADSGQVLRQVYGIQETISALEKTLEVFTHILTPITQDRDPEDGDNMAVAQPRLVPLAEDLRSIERRLDRLRMQFNDLAGRVTI